MLALQRSDSGVALTRVEPPRPASGEVVVKVMCAGLCRTDMYVADGSLSIDSPRILGHECAGVICQLGPEVSPQRLGERVAVFPWIGCGDCLYCAEESLGYLCPDREFLGWHRDGCFAEFMAVPEGCCLTLPQEVSFQAGAYLEPLTAALGILKTPVKKARRPTVMGSNRIAALTRLVLREFAGTEVHEISDEESSFDLIVETEATSESLHRALRLLQPDGLLILKSRPAKSVEWPVRLQVEKEITTMGVSYGNVNMAMLFLKNKHQELSSLWHTPTSIDDWNQAFDSERQGRELQKVFFLPQEHSCAV